MLLCDCNPVTPPDYASLRLTAHIAVVPSPSATKCYNIAICGAQTLQSNHIIYAFDSACCTGYTTTISQLHHATKCYNIAICWA